MGTIKALKDYSRYYPDVEICGYVYETSNYDIFKKMEGNRSVEKISSLKKSMKEHGFQNCPIMINEDFEVSDGQHRLAAARDLKIPLKFVVQPDANLQTTIAVNTGQQNWGTLDYLSSYAAKGIIDYVRFNEIYNKFGVPPRTIHAAMGATLTGGAIDKLIKNGVVKCSEGEYEEACKMLSWLSVFDETIKKSKIRGTKSNLHIALMFARRCEVINTQALTKRVIDNFHVFGSQIGTVFDAVQKTEDAYNFKVAMTNRVYIAETYKKMAAESFSRATGGRKEES